MAPGLVLPMSPVAQVSTRYAPGRPPHGPESNHPTTQGRSTASELGAHEHEHLTQELGITLSACTHIVDNLVAAL